MEFDLTPETIADLQQVRATLQDNAWRLHAEFRRHQAAAESAEFDRNEAERRADMLSTLLDGVGAAKCWQLRAQADEPPSPFRNALRQSPNPPAGATGPHRPER